MECQWCLIPMVQTDIRNIGRRIEVEPKTYVCQKCRKTVTVDRYGQCSWIDEFGKLIHPSHDK